MYKKLAAGITLIFAKHALAFAKHALIHLAIQAMHNWLYQYTREIGLENCNELVFIAYFPINSLTS